MKKTLMSLLRLSIHGSCQSNIRYKFVRGICAAKGKAKHTVSQVRFKLYTNDNIYNAAKEQNHLRKKNQQVDVRDLFIASIAIANDLPFLTLNKKHFNYFSSLKIAETLE
ncbi:MAG: type II toxin-antitoxin system VapC family toxin [bacterium]